MARSIWRTQVAELRKRLPRGASGQQISGIVQTILGTGEGGARRIGGISYTAVMGHEHPLDGQEIDFGEHGIQRDQVPSPWRELLGSPIEPFTFDLDRPDQDSPSAPDARAVARQRPSPRRA
jgi:hypothetical protein